jgi:predicted amidophosphoribosyltransferase
MIWCPQCNAMLPEGTQTCPRCGTKLKARGANEEEVSRRDLVWYSVFSIGVVLIPLLIMVVIGVICVLIFVLT